MLKTINVIEVEAKKRREIHMNNGFTIRQVGIGDGIQFTSLPENYFLKTGQKLIDVSEPWYLDYNPYVLRGMPPKKTIELWNYPKQYEWPQTRKSVYMTNAEIHCNVFGLQDPRMTYPRLYRFENFPFAKREKILFHPIGQSHGALPDEVIAHVLKKYKGSNLFQIGLASDPDLGIQRIHTPTLWDLTSVISEARMLIGVDSGPAWIAACYPDVVVKKIRTKFQYGFCEPKDWIPLDVNNSHSFWDDLSLFNIYNCFETDVGFTKTYRRI